MINKKITMAVLIGVGALFFLNGNHQQSTKQLGSSHITNAKYYSTTYSLGDLFGNNKSTAHRNSVGNNAKTLNPYTKTSNVLPDSGLNSQGAAVVHNSFGGYSPVSNGVIQPQSVPGPVSPGSVWVKPSVVPNPFGGWSPTINGKMLPESVPGPQFTEMGNGVL